MLQLRTKAEIQTAIRESGIPTSPFSSLTFEMDERDFLNCFGQCDQNRDLDYNSKAVKGGVSQDSHNFVGIIRSDKTGFRLEVASGNNRFGMIAKKHNRDELKIILNKDGTIPEFISREDGKVEVRLMLTPVDAAAAKAACLVYNNPALSITASQKRGLQFRESGIEYRDPISKLWTQLKVITRGKAGFKSRKEGVSRTPIDIVAPALEFISSLTKGDDAILPAEFDFKIPLGARAELIQIFLTPSEVKMSPHSLEQAKEFITDFLKNEPTNAGIRETRIQLNLDRLNYQRGEDAWDTHAEMVTDCFAEYLSNLSD